MTSYSNHHRTDCTPQVDRWERKRFSLSNVYRERRAIAAVPQSTALAEALDGAAPPCAEDACLNCPVFVHCGALAGAPVVRRCSLTRS